MQVFWRIATTISIVVTVASVVTASITSLAGSVPAWPQWGQNPQHSGTAVAAGQDLNRILADLTFDPFVPQEIKAPCNFCTHYQAPLIDGRDVFMEFKTGTYSGEQGWNTQIWNEKRLRWQDGRLVEQWNYVSDWKPDPNPFSVGSSPTERWGLNGWEPVFHAVLAGPFIYVPGASGAVWKLNKENGAILGKLTPFPNGADFDPNTFVAGPLAADAAGNIYYNALRFDPTDPYGASGTDIAGAWLVRIGADGSARSVEYRTLVPDAPTTCTTTFSLGQLPWPPSPTATPPRGACGSQRPGINVAPAIAPDGTIYTISRAHLRTRYSYMVAVTADLRPQWHTSLRDFLNDGCNVLLPPNGTPGGCAEGATTGVDPATNERPAGRVIDQSSSSPSIAPDGSILYGSYSRYNFARGHLWKFSPSDGHIVATYDFGWDQTPAVFGHDGTYSIVVKDNHYDAGSYCNDKKFCPVAPAGPYYITQLNANLSPEWKFQNTNTFSCAYDNFGHLKCHDDHPGGFEWCINAPAVDPNGVVYANSEDGNLYAINRDGTLKQSKFLRLALGAAYTPLALGDDGKIYTENFGDLFVVGN